jgi:hypothetical protein
MKGTQNNSKLLSMQVDYNTYKEESFTCRNCGWQGKGDQLSHGDFHEMSMIGDLDCPKCFELIAFWQVPLIEPGESKNPGS